MIDCFIVPHFVCGTFTGIPLCPPDCAEANARFWPKADPNFSENRDLLTSAIEKSRCSDLRSEKPLHERPD